MAQDDEIKLEQQVAASPSRVWEALIRPGLWWSDGVTLEPRIGGQFFEPWSDGGIDHRTSGTITRMEPPHLLAMSLEDEDWDFETAVTINITARGDGSLVSLRHSGWKTAPEAERVQLVADHRSGWTRHLENLGACAESMTDKD